MPPKPPPNSKPAATTGSIPTPAPIPLPQKTAAKGFVTGPIKPMPPRLVIYAVEKWGKTTIGAFAPSPAIFMARNENGYETLLSNDLVPDVPRISIDSWDELLTQLKGDLQGIKTIVLDALGGFERLCHEKVCNEQFKGDWGERGFEGFKRGYDISIAEWLKVFPLLDNISKNQNATIMLLSHYRTRTFKDPMGVDFDRYEPDCHPKTWSVTHKWVDAMLFGKFQTIIEDTNKLGKAKAIGGTNRVMHTTQSDAIVAGNRYRMAEKIRFPNEPSEMWATLHNAINKKEQ